ncbi:MAG: hypothetical protein PVI21_00050 [Candidatus Woesebacteria bacterium]
MSRVREINILHRTMDDSDTLAVILPGFNQDGICLADVLAPALATCDVLTYELPRWGFDQQQLVERLSKAIQSKQYRKIIVYAESAGGLDLAALLRHQTSLHIDHAIFNAAMSCNEDAVAIKWIRAALKLPNWLPVTWALRLSQRKAVNNSPTIETSRVNAAMAAESNSTSITFKQVLGEFDRIANTPRLGVRELKDRIGNLTYMGAPHSIDDCRRMSVADSFVYLRQAASAWKAATQLTVRRINPPSWHGLHCPTPEKPGPVIAEILRALR